MKKMLLIGGIAVLLFASCYSEKHTPFSKAEQTTREKVDSYRGPAVIITRDK